MSGIAYEAPTMPGSAATFRTCWRAFSSSPEATMRRLAKTRPGTRIGGDGSISHSNGATSRSSMSAPSCRQAQGEGGPVPRLRDELERAAVRLCDRPRDEEPEPGSRLRLAAHVDAPELLEHEALLLGGDAGAVVAHAHLDVAVLARRGHLDLVAGDGVLGRVREQVDEQLPQPLAVAPHGRQRAQLRRDADLVVAERDGRRRLAYELLEVDVGEGVREGARLDSRRVEDVGDERGETTRLLLDEGEKRLALLGCELAPTLAQGRRASDNRRHRSPQLVRDERDEVGTQSRKAAQLLGGASFGLERADVLHGGGDLAREQRDQVDLVAGEGVDGPARDREDPEDVAPERERGDRARGEPDARELLLLREERVAGHVRADDGLGIPLQPLDQGAGHRAARALREELGLGLPRARHHGRPVALDEDDGDPVELEDGSELTQEAVESLALIERGAEGAGAPVHGLELIRAAAEPVAQGLRLGGPRLGAARLAAQALGEPADDEPHDDLDAEGQGDVAEVERRRRETVGPRELDGNEQRQRHDRQADA